MLHTRSRERVNGETSREERKGVGGSATKVRNGMVSTGNSSCSLTGTGFLGKAWRSCQSKLKAKLVIPQLGRTPSWTAARSSFTFCKESLMKQLGNDGFKTKLSFTTPEK